LSVHRLVALVSSWTDVVSEAVNVSEADCDVHALQRSEARRKTDAVEVVLISTP